MPSPNAIATCQRKRKFDSIADATDELRRTREKAEAGAERRKECRAYPCLVCFGWHLTSKPLLSHGMKPLPPAPGGEGAA